MKQIHHLTLLKCKRIAQHFLSVVCIGLISLLASNRVYSQKATYNCTANDVRVTSAYLSGPGNSAIDCSSADPFKNAELHLIVNSNTQRIGASVALSLNILNGSSYPLSHCFTGETIKNGSDNNLAFSLGDDLSGISCPQDFTITNLFIGWGTGNTDFCTGSGDFKQPATPSKCRFNGGETIPVTVKLAVDFTFLFGDCNTGGNSLQGVFTPQIDGTNLTSPFTYSWNFGDGNTTEPETANTLAEITAITHTYSAADTYTASLTVTDANNNSKTGTHTFMVSACCNLSAPNITVAPFCSGATVADLPQNDGDQGTYHWYNASDPDNSYELDPTTVLIDGTTYYVSVSSGVCESARTEVTVTVNQKPSVNGNSTVELCVGKTSQLTAESTVGGTYSAVNAFATVTSGGLITAISAGIDSIVYNVTDKGCSNTDTAFVTIDPLPDCTISGSNTLSVGESATYSSAVSDLSTYSYKWAIKMGQTIVTSGTGSSLTYNFTNSGSYTVYDTVTNISTNCYSSCSLQITVKAIGPSITYTQGFYGNLNGTACGSTKQKPINSYTIMAGALSAAGGSIRFGNESNTQSFTLKSNDVVTNLKNPNIYKMLPGGSTPAVLKSCSSWKGGCPNGGYPPTASFDQASTWPGVPIVSSSISNVLLAQTMTLRFNLYFSPTLGDITLTGNVLTFAKSTTSCGSDYATKGTSQTIPCTVFNYLSNHGGVTINNLYKLANDVLGGVTLNNNITISPSDINAALNVINTGFDGGAQIIGVSTSNCQAQVTKRIIESNSQSNTMVIPSDLSVVAYPNPFVNKVRFSVASPISGEASLDVYNIVGQKLANVYNGYLFAGNNKIVDYNVPQSYKGTLIYTLKVGNLQVTGKVIQGK